MGKYIYFGEKVKEYDVRVLNEREVRAAAGILFFFAMIAFLNAWLTGNFYTTKLFVIAFLIDFILRLIINPKYSPTMILGRFIVGNQKVEYVGAPQKRFAWAIGLGLAVLMFYLVVINNIIGPVNLFICLTCLLLLFFESAFGICIGCKIYNFIKHEKAQLCPGGVCEPAKKEEIQKINWGQILVVLTFLLAVFSIPLFNPFDIENTGRIQETKLYSALEQNTTLTDDCIAPDWAVAMGHADLWKLHHNCPN